MTDTFELRVDSIAAGGDGVGRRDGMVVFLPRSAPGDLALVRGERKDRLVRGEIERLLEPSPSRADPCCEHYVLDRCGGCQLQHLTYEAQLEAKGGIIRDALTRIGGVAVTAPEVRPSDRRWRYRRKLTLKIRHASGAVIAGLHRYDAPDEIFALRDCPITEETVLMAWRSVLERADLLPRSPELRGAVRLLDNGFSLTIEGARSWSRHTELFAAVESMLELWWKPEGSSRRLLHARRGGEGVGASFAQVNRGVAAELRGHVAALVAGHGPRTVVDAYAGTGDLAVMLAEQGARVTAIEIDRDAARIGASRLPAGSTMIAASVERALPAALPADLVVVNPPRAGLDPSVCRLLTDPAALIYVSCNPATLARDLKRLSGYRVRSVRGFDMFPQTAHVETVCELTRAS